MKLAFVSKRFRGERLDPVATPDEWILLVDLDRCIGCGACAFACRIEHADSIGDAATDFPLRPVLPEAARTSEGRMACLPGTCRHCPSPCQYHTDYNFWTICPSQETKTATAVFCDTCTGRLDQGQWPACATRCTMKTIYFGRGKDFDIILSEKRLREMGDVEHAG